MKRMTSLEGERVSSKQTAIRLIWVLVGTGCQMFLKNFLIDLIKKWPSDYYKLNQLDPGFQIIFEKNKTMPIPADWQSILNLFDDIESDKEAPKSWKNL